MVRWFPTLLGLLSFGCTGVHELAVLDEGLPSGGWFALAGGVGSSIRTGLFRLEPGALLPLDDRPEILHVFWFSDSDVERHQPVPSELRAPLRFAAEGDLVLAPSWSRTYSVDDVSEPIDLPTPAVTAPWIRSKKLCGNSESLSLAPFGASANLFGEGAEFHGEARVPSEYLFEYVSPAGPDRVVAASRGFLFVFERGRGFLDRPTHLRAIGELSSPASWISALAVGPEREGSREVLVGTSGEAPAVVSLMLGSAGLGPALTATVTRAAVVGISFLADESVFVGGDFDLLLTRVGGEWVRHRTGRSFAAHKNVVETPVGLFVGSSDGLIFFGPDFDSLVEEPLWVGGVQASSAIVSVSASPSGAIFAGTEFHGLLERASSGGRFDAVTVEVSASGSRCAAPTGEETYEVALNVHGLITDDRGRVFVLPRDCLGLLVFRSEDRCASVVDMGGRFERSVAESLKAMAYADGTLTVSGAGTLFQLEL